MAIRSDCFHSQPDDQILDLSGFWKTRLSFLELQKLEMKCMFSEQGLIYLITACVNLSQQRTLFLTKGQPLRGKLPINCPLQFRQKCWAKRSKKRDAKLRVEN